MIGNTYMRQANNLLYILLSVIIITIFGIIVYYIYTNKTYLEEQFMAYILDLIIVAIAFGGIEFMFFMLVSSKYITYAH